MRSAKPVLLIGLLAAAAIVGYLQMESSKQVSSKVDTLAVAAGDFQNDEDLSSPDPLVHCYAAASPDDLDISTRMDFEARTSADWVLAPDESGPGEFCLIETEKAVAKRLAEANPD